MARPKKTTSKKGKSKASIREKARKAAEQRERGGGLDTLKNIPQDVEFFKPKMGKGRKGQNQFSIVPYIVSIENHPFQEAGEPWHECTYWRHKIGFGTDSKSFICPAKTSQAEDKRCPICEERASLLKSGRDPDMADELKPKQRQMFNILDHNEEDKGIQLFEISPHNFGNILDDEDKAQEEDFEGKYYGDWEDGLMITARFNKETFGSGSFPDCVRIDFEERDDLPEEMVMEETIDLDASLKILSYDDIYKGFYELGMESDEEEEEEEPKSSKRSRKSSSSSTSSKRTRKAKEEPEEEPEEEEEEPEEEETEEELEAEEGECPYGHEFGYDCDQTDDCDECESWEECRDLADEIEEEERKKKKGRKK